MSPLRQTFLAGCVAAAAAACAPVAAPPGDTASAPGAVDGVPVFFGSGSATLTPEAEGVVSQAAEKAKAQDPSAVIVTGHANAAEGTSAPPDLSAQRAAAVGQALVEQGVPPDKIRTTAGGAGAAATEVKDRRANIQVIGPRQRVR